MQLASGIYTMDVVTVNAGETLEGVGRVIITRADGTPPSVEIGAGAVLRNVWIGGTRQTQNNAGMYLLDDATADGCVFFGHYGGFSVGGHVRGRVVGCAFVNVGAGDYYHPIYVSQPTANAGDGCTISGNLFLGCEGYAVHLWNDSLGGTHYNNVSNNFIGACHRGIVSKGHDNIIARNVLWSTDSTHSFLSIGAALKWTWNLYGAQVGQLLNQSDSDAVIRNNGFIAPTPTFGKSPQVYDNVRTLLGYSQASITNSVTALVASFTQTPQALLIDTSIDTHKDKLRDVLAHWSVAA